MSKRIPTSKTGAALARNASRQDWGTPREFLAAVERRFGRINWDLAAHAENHVVPSYFGPGSANGEDSLAQDWSQLGGVLFLNPPFANIEPWVAKASAECVSRTDWTLVLVPASIGTNWFAKHVQPFAHVLGLSPRIKFVGADDFYPKDLMLACYGFSARGFDTWKWA
jgi:phage N-6-adenine-methyltransferase